MLTLSLVASSVVLLHQAGEASSAGARQEARPAPSPWVEVVVAPDAPFAVAARFDGRVELVSTHSGETTSVLEPALGNAPWELALSPDGERLAAVDLGGGLSVWDLDDRDRPSVLSVAQVAVGDGDGFREGACRSGCSVQWSPSGLRFAVVTEERTTELRDRAGALVARWPGWSWFSDQSYLAWSSSGAWLAYPEASRVRFREASTGELTAGPCGESWFECGADIRGLALGPRGRLLATGHSNCRLRIWDLASGALLQEVREVEPLFHDPSNAVTSLAFSPDGRRLAWSLNDSAHAFCLDVASCSTIFGSGSLDAVWGEPMRLRWATTGERLFFSFSCGTDDLHRTRLPSGEWESSERSGLVPSFGRRAGAFIEADGRLIGLAPDGIETWIRDP